MLILWVRTIGSQDSRLLGEIHVALLKVIIKDIEDVARTPMGLGMNQNGAANPGGGHPETVEGVSSDISKKFLSFRAKKVD